jgi:hypothetical protein
MPTTEKEINEAIAAAKAAANITYDVLVFEAPEKSPGADDGETFAFRRPSSAEWMRYRSERVSDSTLAQVASLKTLCQACRVYPSMVEFMAAIDARPGLVESIGNELIQYAGAEKAKKVRRL